jgi:hypothetical protein
MVDTDKNTDIAAGDKGDVAHETATATRFLHNQRQSRPAEWVARSSKVIARAPKRGTVTPAGCIAAAHQSVGLCTRARHEVNGIGRTCRIEASPSSGQNWGVSSALESSGSRATALSALLPAHSLSGFAIFINLVIKHLIHISYRRWFHSFRHPKLAFLPELREKPADFSHFLLPCWRSLPGVADRLALDTVKATLDFVYQCNRLAAPTNGGRNHRCSS